MACFRLMTIMAMAITSSIMIHVDAYNRPGCKGWPNEEEWDLDLRKKLSDPSLLHGPFVKQEANKAYNEQCLVSDEQTVVLLSQGMGLCMNNHACVNERCLLTETSSMPAYTVEAVSVEDVQVAMAFVNKYDIGVAVKSSGHSFQGQSMQADSLLIWLRKVVDNTVIIGNGDGISTNFTDTCGTDHGPTIGLAAGENFEISLARVGRLYNLVPGICRTVSSSGGWLQGGGLSFLSRMHGFGLDNVRSMQVILADGSLVTADACTNPDLFWALRGGGGGNFGIVVNAEYQLYPSTGFTELVFGSGAISTPFAAIGVPKRKKEVYKEWVRFFVENLSEAPREWTGGLIKISGPAPMLFQGTLQEAKNSPLIKAMDEWHANLIASGKLNLTTDEWACEYPKPSEKLSFSETLYDLRGAEGEFGIPDSDTVSIPGRLGRGISRFIPLSATQERPDELIDLIIDIGLGGVLEGIYWLGGATADPAIDATAIHPGARQVVWGMNPTCDIGNNKIIEFAGKDKPAWSVSYNHHDALEKQVIDTLWGPVQYPKLQAIKRKFDPQHRFNVYHGVDFIPLEDMEKCALFSNRDPVNVGYIVSYLKSFFRQVVGAL